MVWGMNASNMHTSNLTNTQRWTLYLNWTDKTVKTEYMDAKIISMFRTAVHFFLPWVAEAFHARFPVSVKS